MDTAPCLDFLRRLLSTESLPGREANVAALVDTEMRALGYDGVRRDDAGNVIGLIRGDGRAPAMMFNTHLDHVDVGDPAAWPHPPFAATIVDGRVFGRGAVDIKGPLAAQVHGVGSLCRDGSRPPGDVYVTAVVQEEVGGLGARHLVGHLKPSFVIVGEPSGNQLRRGHRGRTEAVLRVGGRSVHASVPHLGVNPLQVVARFITALESLPMRPNADLGPSSVAPTLIKTDQTSPNVIPSEILLTCDWRNVPGESPEDVRDALAAVAARCLVPGATATVELPEIEERSYTGYRRTYLTYFPPFLVPDDHAAVRAAASVLAEAIGLQDPVGVWKFATDGGHFAAAGQTVVGFGPGEETLAHTIHEAIDVSALETAMSGNRSLALHWTHTIAANA